VVVRNINKFCHPVNRRSGFRRKVKPLQVQQGQSPAQQESTYKVESIVVVESFIPETDPIVAC
jgi:hypothetical protein